MTNQGTELVSRYCSNAWTISALACCMSSVSRWGDTVTKSAVLKNASAILASEPRTMARVLGR